MKIGVMLGDILNSAFRKPATQMYPFERHDTPERLRGKVHWEKGTCTGCAICASDCPAGALEMIVLDKKAKRFVMRYQIDQCTFCAQCVASCKQDSISLSDEEWELAAFSRDGMMVYYGAEEDIRQVLTGVAPEVETQPEAAAAPAEA